MTDTLHDNDDFGINSQMSTDERAAACGMDPHEYREQMLDWLDSDNDDTDVSFVCSSTGSVITYDCRSLRIAADNGRYNALCAFEERMDSELGEIRRRSIKVARRSVVICDGIIVSETLERAVDELRSGRNGDAVLVCVSVVDGENLHFTFLDD
jgi:hypothetical protein